MDAESLRRQGKRLLVWLVAAAVVAATVGVVWAGTPYRGTDESVAAVADDPAVTLTRTDGTYVLDPAGGDAERGLVFYPGARVHPDAYLATLAPIAAETNTRVVVPSMPLSLAFFDQGAASRYVTDDVEWYVGGHSLGGAMACRYAAANPDAVAGLVLFASYCDRDISGTGLAALSVTGTADTVLDRDTYEASLANLPADATVRDLPGLNHTQFGAYSGQPGDAPSGSSYDRAHARLANVTVPWFQRR